MKILYSAEAEQSVLGSLLLENACFDDVSDLITENDFYVEKHRIIFREIVKLLTENLAADWLTLCEELKKAHSLESVGGSIYIVDLIRYTPTYVNVREYAKIVKNYTHQRKLKDAALQIIALIENEETDILDKAGTLILSVSETKSTEPKTTGDYISQALEETIDVSEDDLTSIFLKTGFDKIDEIIVGLEKTALVLLAARPGMGKTMLAINIAENISINQKKSVLVFSLEMTAKSLGKRILFKMANVASWKSKKPSFLTQDDITNLGLAATLIKQNTLDIDDAANLTIMDIRAKARRMKKRKGLDLIVIDYIQLIRATEGENENIKLGYISKGLKSLAKELDVPILVLSQLNRNIENRANRKPQMSDLRQSGALEQDADVIIFIDRPEKYDETAPLGLAKIYVEKNRDGSTGEANLIFRGDFGKFEDSGNDFNYYSNTKRITTSRGFIPKNYTEKDD